MVKIEVNEGVLEGEIVRSEIGGTYCSFKGIPYAEPPVGDLRFKAPQPPKPWKGVRSAKEFGSICYQYDFFFKVPSIGSEDCLYLNVYTPDVKPKKLLPVMFWIHGGGFVWGSGNDDVYGPEFLVRQGVILVTFNYRLQVVGFLSLHTEEVPGNAGMKDQVAALRWVRKNIERFGGDPNNITIFGESAGAASVTYHLISPMSKGLFRRAIAQSGAATCWWSQAVAPRERARALANKLGFESDDDKELYKFFKSQPIESLIQVKVPVTLQEVATSRLTLNFGVVSEKQFGDNERFFYGNVDEALRNGIHQGVEVIAGYVPEEASVSLGMGYTLDGWIAEGNAFLDLFVPKTIALNCPVEEQLEAGKKVKQFYFKKKNISVADRKQLMRYISFDMLIYGILKWQKVCGLFNPNKLYVYKFSCLSERNVFKKVFGTESLYEKETPVCHCDDLTYLFTNKLEEQKVKKDSESFKLIEKVTKLWTNFAKYGDPTPDDSLGAHWKPYDPYQQHYLDIGNRLTSATHPEKEEMEFWEDIHRQYLPYLKK